MTSDAPGGGRLIALSFHPASLQRSGRRHCRLPPMKEKTDRMRRVLLALVTAGAISTGAASAATAAVPPVVHISAAASGLRYAQKVVHARAGKIKIMFTNPSPLKHNVNVEHGEQELGKSATIHNSKTSFFVTLKAGKCNFYCSVPGHEAAGRRGTLIVA